MEQLFEKLEKNAFSDRYPYHMPGHKRQSRGMLPEELSRIDITEIDGFDNLHQPEGILLALQREAARIYGAEESFYLVNGSTCGILSALSAALPRGGHLLMGRSCHKSAYHAAYLRNLKLSYLYPSWLAEYDILDAVTPRQVEEALEREPEIGAVLVVSPTYEGRIADVGRIAEIVHEKGIPLIVDEAHGAHLGLAEGLAENSCRLGGDLVIHSVHKTLPALTQTALLHVNGPLIDRGLLRRFLHIYQSSSPSYPLMASIDNALRYVEREGQEAFRVFLERYREMTEVLQTCRNLKFLPLDSAGQDVGKLLISVKGTGMTGRALYDVLLEKYHLQMEMASESFVLAMFTVADGEEAYRRMKAALLEIDADIGGGSTREPLKPDAHQPAGGRDINSAEGAGQDMQTCGIALAGAENPEAGGIALAKAEDPEAGGIVLAGAENPETGRIALAGAENPEPDRIPLAEAWDQETEAVPLRESAGRYAGEFINLYPPGIPLLVPGERIGEALCRRIEEDAGQGLTVQGVEKRENGELFVTVLKVQVREKMTEEKAGRGKEKIRQ